MPLTEGFYRQLTVSLLQPRVKNMIEVRIMNVKTGDDAKMLAAAQNDKGWSYDSLDTLGRVGVLKFRGTEVALFFKRQSTNFKTEDIDPVPERTIADPEEAWARMEFFHTKSSKKRSSWFADREKELMDSVEAFRGLAHQRDVENDQLQQKVQAMSQTISTLRKRLSTPTKGGKKK